MGQSASSVDKQELNQVCDTLERYLPEIRRIAAAHSATHEEDTPPKVPPKPTRYPVSKASTSFDPLNFPSHMAFSSTPTEIYPPLHSAHSPLLGTNFDDEEPERPSDGLGTFLDGMYGPPVEEYLLRQVVPSFPMVTQPAHHQVSMRFNPFTAGPEPNFHRHVPVLNNTLQVPVPDVPVAPSHSPPRTKVSFKHTARNMTEVHAATVPQGAARVNPAASWVSDLGMPELNAEFNSAPQTSDASAGLNKLACTKVIECLTRVNGLKLRLEASSQPAEVADTLQYCIKLWHTFSHIFSVLRTKHECGEGDACASWHEKHNKKLETFIRHVDACLERIEKPRRPKQLSSLLESFCTKFGQWLLKLRGSYQSLKLVMTHEEMLRVHNEYMERQRDENTRRMQFDNEQTMVRMRLGDVQQRYKELATSLDIDISRH